jgi:NAD(P)-dependent dehydrogenase (short-subunit alcohol dehydrogenase family)
MAAEGSLEGQVAVVTGGSGALGKAVARGLAAAGASVGLLARSADAVEASVEALAARGAAAFALTADVLDRDALERARAAVLERHGRLDILVNAAGGNVPEATVGEGQSFFDLPVEALRHVVDLNLFGTVLPCQVLGAAMTPRSAADDTSRSIVNVSSMAAARALTRVAGYGAAKAAVESFTRWLAVDCARSYGDRLRVNAIAPGFFVSEQNRAVLIKPDGSFSERAQKIVARTPMGRFGKPEELVGAVIWLCSDAASFVTGTVIPIDGGFSAFSGV